MTDVPPDAFATAAAIREGAISAREAVEAAIAGFEKHDPTLNCLVATRFEQALAEVDAGLPEGPLTGVPTVVKDLGMQVAGLPLTRGSRLWADDVADRDSELVARFRRAGMVVLGMSNSPELGKNASTEPLLHGPTHNPWSTGHSAGGSSGGSAAAVAAGIVPVAHGSDGGGSIRIPASMCGLFGLKPSRGRVTAYPDPEVLASPLSVHHALTRSVRDSALLLDLSSAPLPGAAAGVPAPSGSFVEEMRSAPGRLRIGLLTSRPDGAPVDPQVLEATGSAAALCEELGHEVVETTWPHDPEATMSAFGTLMGVSLVHQVEERLAHLGRELRVDDLEPFTRAMYEHYRATLTAVDVHRALGGIQAVGWSVGRRFGGFDLMLSPTLPLPVPELGFLDTSDLQSMWERAGDYSALTAVINVTGQPAMSVPFGQDSAGLPIGVQFVADLGREGVLLALAARIEAARPWSLAAPGYDVPTY